MTLVGQVGQMQSDGGRATDGGDLVRPPGRSEVPVVGPVRILEPSQDLDEVTLPRLLQHLFVQLGQQVEVFGQVPHADQRTGQGGSSSGRFTRPAAAPAPQCPRPTRGRRWPGSSSG
ncbi:hypothetical protein [Ornithinimicrobium kibberense]|uniref:hypothetical protein n=1 Tax=Ornithinimicrobium kibberense TaxID=282060 RepID=UPI0036109E91